MWLIMEGLAVTAAPYGAYCEQEETACLNQWFLKV